jgi:hypothetical protein
MAWRAHRMAEGRRVKVMGGSVRSLALLTLFVAACHRSPPRERTNANVETAPVEDPAAVRIARHDGYSATVQREQLELRGRLREDIQAIDAELATRHGTSTRAEITRLLARRSLLEEDVGTLDRADERGWDELKATIENDLDGARPDDRI